MSMGETDLWMEVQHPWRWMEVICDWSSIISLSCTPGTMEGTVVTQLENFNAFRIARSQSSRGWKAEFSCQRKGQYAYHDGSRSKGTGNRGSSMHIQTWPSLYTQNPLNEAESVIPWERTTVHYQTLILPIVFPSFPKRTYNNHTLGKGTNQTFRDYWTLVVTWHRL